MLKKAKQENLVGFCVQNIPFNTVDFYLRVGNVQGRGGKAYA